MHNFRAYLNRCLMIMSVMQLEKQTLKDAQLCCHQYFCKPVI